MEHENLNNQETVQLGTNIVIPHLFFVVEEIDDGVWEQITVGLNTYEEAKTFKDRWDGKHPNAFIVASLNVKSEKKFENISDISNLFQGEYDGIKIKIEEKFLKQGKERELFQKLKNFNLGSGHEEMKLSKIDDDNFVFHLETYIGGTTQTIYFKRLK